VDKNTFITLLQRYADSSAEEAEEVVSLKSLYPYSQILHTLSAKVTRDHGFEIHQQELQLAAVHAADRAVLKEIIQSDSLQDHRSDSIKNEVSTPQASQETSTPTESRITTIQSIEGFDVADEVMRDLEKLNSLRNNFEMLFVEYSEVNAKPATPENIADNKPEAITVKTEVMVTKTEEIAPPKEKVKSTSKSKKQRIIELAKSMNAVDTQEEKNSKSKSQQDQSAGRKGFPVDTLIEEITSTKEEIVPESEKQKEQIEIINQFIKTQPSISNSKDRQGPPIGDLNPIKSGEFGDNIVSETLVEILIKQGKKDKAIEVLKKLIWKYPQKKSYFASQIEDLKK
jgi:hypothetical protein